MKLTAHQLEILKALATGELMTVDTANCASVGGRPVQQTTRAFLVKHRLVKLLDSTRGAGVRGNGFSLTEAGRQAIV